jgi:hypothetical protein
MQDRNLGSKVSFRLDDIHLAAVANYANRLSVSLSEALRLLVNESLARYEQERRQE